MERTIPKHTGVPTFFRGCCYEASQGGAKTYRNAAWHLAIHLNDQVPYDTELDDWQNHIEERRAGPRGNLALVQTTLSEMHAAYPKSPQETVRQRRLRCVR